MPFPGVLAVKAPAFVGGNEIEASVRRFVCVRFCSVLATFRLAPAPQAQHMRVTSEHLFPRRCGEREKLNAWVVGFAR